MKDFTTAKIIPLGIVCRSRKRNEFIFSTDEQFISISFIDVEKFNLYLTESLDGVIVEESELMRELDPDCDDGPECECQSEGSGFYFVPI